MIARKGSEPAAVNQTSMEIKSDREIVTRLVAQEVYPSKEALDGALQSGMEHGMRETMDQLDALVASLR